MNRKSFLTKCLAFFSLPFCFSKPQHKDGQQTLWLETHLAVSNDPKLFAQTRPCSFMVAATSPEDIIKKIHRNTAAVLAKHQFPNDNIRMIRYMQYLINYDNNQI